MKLRADSIRAWMLFALMAAGAPVSASGQASSAQPLGDVARTARKEHSKTRASEKQTANDEDDGPDLSGVWRVHLCGRTTCSELSVTLPRQPRWSRATVEPRPVLIPLSSDDEAHGRTIRVYAAESLEPVAYLDKAEKTFLQGRFARPEYFGQAARIRLDEHVQLDGSPAMIAHFTITTDVVTYRGQSFVAASLNGNYGFACVFREEDSASAASICDAIIKSARSQELQPASRPNYPQADDRPGEDDPL